MKKTIKYCDLVYFMRISKCNTIEAEKISVSIWKYLFCKT